MLGGILRHHRRAAALQRFLGVPSKPVDGALSCLVCSCSATLQAGSMFPNPYSCCLRWWFFLLGRDCQESGSNRFLLRFHHWGCGSRHFFAVGEFRSRFVARQQETGGMAELYIVVVLDHRCDGFALRSRHSWGHQGVTQLLRCSNGEFGRPRRLIGSVSVQHGRVLHGLQFLDESKRRQPTSYYSTDSGIGSVLTEYPGRAAGKDLRIGVVGLGVGTIAAYGKPGDYIQFYEINPEVIRLASGQNDMFSFLGDSRAQIDVVPGDARLSLEQELAQGAELGILMCWRSTRLVVMPSPSISSPRRRSRCTCVDLKDSYRNSGVSRQQ